MTEKKVDRWFIGGNTVEAYNITWPPIFGQQLTSQRLSKMSAEEIEEISRIYNGRTVLPLRKVDWEEGELMLKEIRS